MTNLLILAAGEGTRTSMFTYNNAMPKCLMSVGDKTCLEAIMHSYDGLVDNVYVAVQNKHVQIVKDILKFKKVKAIVVGIEPQMSAMSSLEAALKTSELANYEAHDWYINWSDVFAEKMPLVKTDTIFIDSNYIHRNLAFHNHIVQVESTDNLQGNVPGIFYLSGGLLKRAIKRNYVTGMRATTDLDKLLSLSQHVGPIELHKLDNIVDVGDYQKYAKHMLSNKQENVCRYFNSLEFTRATVTKKPITEKGEALHTIELAYYRRFGDKCPSLAKLLGYNVETKTMTLERIKGRTCQSVVNSKTKPSAKLAMANKLIKKFEEGIKSFHDLQNIDVLDSPEAILTAIRDEFYYKINERVNPCYSAIEAVIEANGIKSIDGLPVVSREKLMHAVNTWLEAAIANNKFELGITHGDPNTDNTMLSSDGRIRFVDPRGYFGSLKTLGYGVTMYDLAKFVYGFSGYGRFNSAEFITTRIENGDAQVFVGVSESQGLADVPIFDMNVSDDVKILVGIIWVKLTSYIINDPMKSVAAYLYGNAILTKLLNIA